MPELDPPRLGQGARAVRRRRRTRCCSSPRTASRRSTSCCRRRSRDKGRVLTGLSAFWFAQTASIVPNHLLSLRLEDVPGDAHDPALRGRVMLVRRLEMLPVEFVVRGYLAGSGLHDYQPTGAVSRRRAAPGPAPGRPPARADRHAGHRRPRSGHDENITADQARELVRRRALRPGGGGRARRLRARRRARPRPRHRPRRHEVRVRPRRSTASSCSATRSLTPDSSRFWPAESVVPGTSPPSFDKQYVRDWLEHAAVGQDRTPAPSFRARSPRAPPTRYREAYDAAHRPTVLRLPRRAGSRMRVIRARPAEAGHPRPAGRGHRAQPLGSRPAVDGVRAGKVFDLELAVDDPGRGAPRRRRRRRAGARERPDRGLRGRCSREPAAPAHRRDLVPGLVRRPRRRCARSS